MWTFNGFLIQSLLDRCLPTGLIEQWSENYWKKRFSNWNRVLSAGEFGILAICETNRQFKEEFMGWRKRKDCAYIEWENSSFFTVVYHRNLTAFPHFCVFSPFFFPNTVLFLIWKYAIFRDFKYEVYEI